MAYIDEELTISDEQTVALNNRIDLLSVVKAIVWQLYESHKNESYKIKIWGIPISVKVEKIRPILEVFFGSVL